MIYDPANYNDWEWRRVDRLLLSDPILYTWMHWEVENARMLDFKLDFKRDSIVDMANLFMPRFWIRNHDDRSPFVTPPI
jgi:hypothetical protein